MQTAMAGGEIAKLADRHAILGERFLTQHMPAARGGRLDLFTVSRRRGSDDNRVGFQFE